jgi:hypothetical protein
MLGVSMLAGAFLLLLDAIVDLCRPYRCLQRSLLREKRFFRVGRL